MGVSYLLGLTVKSVEEDLAQTPKQCDDDQVVCVVTTQAKNMKAKRAGVASL